MSTLQATLCRCNCAILHYHGRACTARSAGYNSSCDTTKEMQPKERAIARDRHQALHLRRRLWLSKPSRLLRRTGDPAINVHHAPAQQRQRRSSSPTSSTSIICTVCLRPGAHGTPLVRALPVGGAMAPDAIVRSCIRV